MHNAIAVTSVTRKPDRSVLKWFIGLLLLGVVMRLLLWLTYEPISYGDTGSYLRLGQWVSGIGERGFDGTRVPGYPVFLALMGLDPHRIWLGQMALGMVISALLFWMGWRTTERAGVGFLLGALYSLIPGQLLFEANLLSETLTTFFVVLSMTLYLGIIQATSVSTKIGLAAGLGISASFVGMVRPLFFPLTVILLPFVWFGVHATKTQRLSIVAIYAIFPLLIQGGWLLYMRMNWGVLSPTTMAGYSMVQHTGGYFEYLPDEYADIRDTYIQYRDAQIAERGVQTNAIWEAIPAITKASGIGFYDLAREMSRLSWMLVREHPELYLQNVVTGWISFWKAPVYWQPESIHPTVVRTIFHGLVWIGRGLSVLSNIAFVAISLSTILGRRLRSWFRMDASLWLSVAMVGAISVLQTLLDHGDNPRFLVPLQMVVILVVISNTIRFMDRGANPMRDA